MNKQISAAEGPEDAALVGYLKTLAARQDRAALAHLRRGLGRRPGEAVEMYPYVGRFINEKTNDSHDRAVFLTSALFAAYPEAPQNTGDLGRSVRQLADKAGSDSIERRFVALLDADTDVLHYYLRQMVGLLKAHGIAVNWNRLFEDIRDWDRSGRVVQRRWARSFWGSAETNNTTDTHEGGE
ncbi:MAG: type I-E CRISPR-associated protein Cse2/CasB [Pyrinomonadaceae bacterium]